MKGLRLKWFYSRRHFEAASVCIMMPRDVAGVANEHPGVPGLPVNYINYLVVCLSSLQAAMVNLLSNANTQTRRILQCCVQPTTVVTDSCYQFESFQHGATQGPGVFFSLSTENVRFLWFRWTEGVAEPAECPSSARPDTWFLISRNT